ncbi:MAG: hypothetical protein AAGI01_14625 [Myxococcota bacterium]
MTPSATMLDAWLGLGALAWTDADGRPLGERAQDAAYHAAGVEERACPFQDERQGAPAPVINMAALRQVRGHWGELLEHVRWAGRLHCADGVRMTWAQLARVVSSVHGTPVVWGLKHPDQLIPRRLSALFKTTLGFSKLFPTMILDDEERAPRVVREEFTPRAFFTWLDEGHWLIGSHQVCAGSTRSIMEYFDALTAPWSGPAKAPEGVGEQAARAMGEEGVTLFAQALGACAMAGQIAATGELDEAPGFASGEAAPEERAAWPVWFDVFDAAHAPCAEQIRQRPFASPLLPALLFVDGEYPDDLVAFWRALESTSAPGALARVDLAFLRTAQPVLDKLCAKVGVTSSALAAEDVRVLARSDA